MNRMTELLQELYKYKHVSFDLWLTIIQSNPEFKPKRNKLFRDFFAIDRPLEDVSAAIRKFDILTNGINEKVGRNFDTFEIIYLILDALSIDIEKISGDALPTYYQLSEELLMQHKPLLLFDDIASVLEKLKANGQTTNILSNTAFIKGTSLRPVLAHYGLEAYFDFQIYSDEVGYSKPSREIYECAYIEILKLDASTTKNQVIHIGDNMVSDYEGAKNFGFDAHLLIHTKTNESKLQPA